MVFWIKRRNIKAIWLYGKVWVDIVKWISIVFERNRKVYFHKSNIHIDMDLTLETELPLYCT